MILRSDNHLKTCTLQQVISSFALENTLSENSDFIPQVLLLRLPNVSKLILRSFDFDLTSLEQLMILNQLQ